MSLKDLFLIFSKDDYEKELKRKISALEMNIEELKKSFSLMQKNEQEHEPVLKEPPIIIERINIDKIILDKYELNNNFGQLGIKELKGRLNIGATYGSEFIPRTMSKEKVKTEKCKSEAGLKVNIKAKNTDEKD